MTNKSGQTRQSTNDLRDELIGGGGGELRQVTTVDVSLLQLNNIATTDIFNQKKKVLQSSML